MPTKANDTLFVGVNGNKTRVRTLPSHLLTSAHIDCEKVLNVQVNPEKAALPGCPRGMNEDVKENLKLFNISYYVAKKEEPFRK